MGLWELGFAFGSVVVVLFGAAIGSFLNVIIYRYSQEGMSIFSPARSFCPSCKRKLRGFENLPILSFLILKGRCRTCQAPIPRQYLLVEILTPTLLWAVFAMMGWTLSFLGGVLITLSLIVVFFVDLHTSTISDWNWIVVAGGSALLAWDQNLLLINGIVSAVVLGLFLLVFWVYRGRFGIGDVLLITAASFGLGMVGITLAILIASLSGLIIALILRKKMKDTIPFGPFLAIGIYVAMLFAERLYQLLWM